MLFTVSDESTWFSWQKLFISHGPSCNNPVLLQHSLFIFKSEIAINFGSNSIHNTEDLLCRAILNWLSRHAQHWPCMQSPTPREHCLYISIALYCSSSALRIESSPQFFNNQWVYCLLNRNNNWAIGHLQTVCLYGEFWSAMWVVHPWVYSTLIRSSYKPLLYRSCEVMVCNSICLYTNYNNVLPCCLCIPYSSCLTNALTLFEILTSGSNQMNHDKRLLMFRHKQSKTVILPCVFWECNC
jgi:hypothetical protein